MRSLALALLAAVPLGVACIGPEPVVQQRSYAPRQRALERLAVIPFYPHRLYEGSRRLGGVPAEEAAERVAKSLTQALVERGFAVIPPADLAAALEGMPRSTAVMDAATAAELAGRKLGATGVLVGEVQRFRQRRGVSPAASRSSSVAFQVTLYEAPGGLKLWTARFDETQAPPNAELEGDADGAAAATRWLSADELARRGAEAIAESLAQGR